MIKAIILILMTFSVFSWAQQEEDPFAGCDQATNNTTYLNCMISVVDDYIEDAFGKKGLKEANKIVKKECKSGGNVRLDPKLRLLTSLQCEFDTKVEYYNSRIEE